MVWGSIIPLLQILAQQEVVRRGRETQARQHRANGLTLGYFRKSGVCPTGSAHTAEEGSTDLLGIGLRSKRQVQDGVVSVHEIALHRARGVVGIAMRQRPIASE